MGDKISEKDADNPDSKPLPPGDKDKGPIGDRKCTDPLCLVFLVCNWIAFTCVGAAVLGWYDSPTLPAGDPRRLVNGIDYLGQICGIDGGTDVDEATGMYRRRDVQRRPKAYYLPSGAAVCVTECPSETDFNSFICEYEIQDELDALKAAMNRGDGTTPSPTPAYVSGSDLYGPPDDVGDVIDIVTYPPTAVPTMVPTTEETPSPTYTPTPAPTYDATTAMMFYYKAGFEGLQGYKCNFLWKSTDYLGYCVPDEAVDLAMAAGESAASEAAAEYGVGNVTMITKDDGSSYFEDFSGDMYTASGYIFGFGVGVASFVGFVYLLLIRIPCVLDIVIWGIVAAIGMIFAGGAAYAIATAQTWAKEDPPLHAEFDVKAMTYTGTGMEGLTVAYIIVIICVRKRILLALGVIKEAAKALGTMPTLILFPIVQAAGICVFLIPWTIYMLFLASSGDAVAISYEATEGVYVTYKQFVYSKTQKQACLYFFFTYYWTSEFIVAIGQLVIAISVVRWYFTRNKLTIGPWTPIFAVKDALWYHAGSAAFGSCIIAIIKTIKLVLYYLETQLESIKNPQIRKVAMVGLKIMQCCMWCVEKCMKFINKVAYIQIAIYSCSFCTGAKKAFFLILRNVVRIAVVKAISSFVLMLGVIFITSFTTFLAYTFMETQLGDQLSGLYGPTFFVMLLAYFTATMFNEIFNMCIDTVLQCFIADEEMFKDPNDRFASGDLGALIGKTNKAAAAIKKGTDGCSDMSEGERGALQKRFDTFDADGSGAIDVAELQLLLEKSIGAKPDEAETKKIMKKVDTGGDGTMDFDEFVAVIQKVKGGKLKIAAFEKMVKEFNDMLASLPPDDDSDGDGDGGDGDGGGGGDGDSGGGGGDEAAAAPPAEE